jgi:uncharacterized protein YndB with AHSA1/START domain
MGSIVREIRIDADPEVVREHVTDADRRAGWLDDAPERALPTPDGVTYRRGDGDDATRVTIEVLPDGDGSRVRVTEEAVPLQPPAADPTDTPPTSARLLARAA